MTPGFLKMPEPITPPTTIITVVNRPREGRRPALEVRRVEGGSVVAGTRGKLQTSNIKLQESLKPQTSNGRPDPLVASASGHCHRAGARGFSPQQRPTTN